MNKLRKSISWVALVLSVLALLVWFVAPGESPIARSYQTGIYKTDGGDTQVITSNGKLVATPGATIDVGDVGIDVLDAQRIVLANPTAATTATPGVYSNTAADDPDLFVLAKDGTPEVYVHNDGTLEVEGNVVLASANYPVEHGSAGRELYFGVTGAFTGTTTVLSTTTGIENVVAVLCQVDDPDDDSGDAFLCIGSGSDGDVTLTALDNAGDESTEADTTVYYVILGY